MSRWIRENGEFIIFCVLTLGGTLLLYFPLLPNELLGALVGALYGGAALLLGNWIARFHERVKSNDDMEHRRERLKTLITAELVDITARLIEARESIQVVIADIRASGVAPEVSLFRGRDVSRTHIIDALLPDLLILDAPAIDALATLRSGLSTTQRLMDEMSASRNVGTVRVQPLRNSVNHDMEVLAKCYERIAPARRIQLPGQPPELASVALRRIAKS